MKKILFIIFLLLNVMIELKNGKIQMQVGQTVFAQDMGEESCDGLGCCSDMGHTDGGSGGGTTGGGTGGNTTSECDQGADDVCDPTSMAYDPAACQNKICDPGSFDYDISACADKCNPTSPTYDETICQSTECDPNGVNYNPTNCDINSNPCNPMSPNYDINANCDNTDGEGTGGGWGSVGPGGGNNGGGSTGGGTGGGGNTNGTALYRDLDNDGWGDWSAPYSPVWAYTSSHWIARAGDHNDFCYDPSNSPNQCPSVYYQDLDGDGWGNDAVTYSSFGPGRATQAGDFNDNCYDTLNSGDQCKNDSNGYNDYFRDADGDGWGDILILKRSQYQPSGYVLQVGDVNDNCYDVNNALTQCAPAYLASTDLETALISYLNTEKFALIRCNVLPLFKNLANFTPPQQVTDRLESLNQNTNYPTLWHDPYLVQNVKNATGAAINLDRFEIEISELPVINGQRVTAEEFLDYIRINLNAFIDNSITTFEPYVSPTDNIDDRNKWVSSNPLGTLLHLEIKGPLLGGPPDDGTVVVSDFASNQFTVSTLRVPLDDAHPVSGNRKWGFDRSSINTYTFYVMGADRLTSGMQEIAQAVFGLPFRRADDLWKSFQSKVEAFVLTHGGSAYKKQPITERPDYGSLKDYFNGTINLQTLKDRHVCQ